MLLKCYHILHPMVEFGFVIDMQLDEEKSFNIFEMFVRTSEPTKVLVNKELQMFMEVSCGCEGDYISFGVVGETRVFISKCNISYLSIFWHCWFLNKN